MTQPTDGLDELACSRAVVDQLRAGFARMRADRLLPGLHWVTGHALDWPGGGRIHLPAHVAITGSSFSRRSLEAVVAAGGRLFRCDALGDFLIHPELLRPLRLEILVQLTPEFLPEGGARVETLDEPLMLPMDYGDEAWHSDGIRRLALTPIDPEAVT